MKIKLFEIFHYWQVNTYLHSGGLYCHHLKGHVVLCFDPEDGGTTVFWYIDTIYQGTWPNSPEDWGFTNIAVRTSTVANYNCVKVAVIVFLNGVNIWLKGSHQLGKGEFCYGVELNVTTNYVQNIFICEWLHIWLYTKLLCYVSLVYLRSMQG